MRILICNDDGIFAPGILALREALQGMGELIVVAPEAEQSAVGHAITVSSPLRAKPVNRQGEYFGQAVNGTPADCVKLAVSEILDDRPDLLVSGINLGANSGISVLYSGTVSGATEGTILGIPSIAFSLCTFQNPEWESAARVARAIVQSVEPARIPPDTLLNVNIPNLPFDQLKGIEVVPIAKSRWVEEFDARTDPRGHNYYWMCGVLQLVGAPGNNDVSRLEEGYVSVTPLQLDMTNYRELDNIAGWPFRLEPTD
jgi:5'-nucleotidase